MTVVWGDRWPLSHIISIVGATYLFLPPETKVFTLTLLRWLNMLKVIFSLASFHFLCYSETLEADPIALEERCPRPVLVFTKSDPKVQRRGW